MSESSRNLNEVQVAPSMGWFRGLLCLPLVMAVLVMFVSPNFRTDGELNRAAPPGGDFLQEWVGAYVVGSANQNQLYDLDHSKAIQHDASVVGFLWPEKDYFPMVYPPFYYQALRPLAALDYFWAMKIWLVLSGLAVSLACWLLFNFYEPCRKWLGTGIVAAVLFAPLLVCFNMGQKSTFLLLILTGTFVLFHNKKPFCSGLVFGLIAFKPHLGLVIGITMLLKGHWRFAVGALATVSVLVGVSFFANPQLWYDYGNVVGGMNDYVETGGYQLADSHSLWGAAELTFSKFSAPDWLVKAVAIMLGLVVAGLLWRVVRGKTEVGEHAISAMVFATVMLSPHFYSYDLTILLLPMLLIATSMSRQRPISNEMRVLGFVCLGFFVLSGMFKTMAASTGFQFSIPLMVGVLFLLGTRKSDQLDD